MAGSILTSNRPERIEAGAGLAGQGHSVVADSASTDLWIFRDGKKVISGPQMLSGLRSRIATVAGNSGSLIDALIEAGQFESALADAGNCFADMAAELTDALAFALCGGNFEIEKAVQLASRLQTPDSLSISAPEGFTYYALHPLDFASCIGRVPADPGHCALIGIRSIGTTLSAVSAAALKKCGREASRITVRPTGHPYARETELTLQQQEWIHSQLATGAQFVIVDEGPGRSGSTFLSVAEALLRAGVPRQLITMLGSRQPDPASLCADDAVTRWNALRFIATTPSVNARFAGCTYIGSGNWRELANLQNWPESWTQMERLKFLAPGHATLFKFEGMGPIGEQVRARAFVMAKAGFGPQASDAGDGFLAYEWLDGRRLGREAISRSLLERLAEYCAFRVFTFPMPHSDGSELRKMLEFNVHSEFGVELSLPQEVFATGTTVVTDGRMQPYEWIAPADGSVLKTDGVSHGDDHFFPGPCDIAWDLAGIAVEWQLDPAAQEFLLAEFRRLTGIDKSNHMRRYMLAYAVFRLGFCKMAISTVRGTPEEQRLRSSYQCYRIQAQQASDVVHYWTVKAE